MRKSPRTISMKGRNDVPAPSAVQWPSRISADSPSSRRLSSWTSRDLPIPASPTTCAMRSAPAPASRQQPASTSSSSRRPTRGPSPRRTEVSKRVAWACIPSSRYTRWGSVFPLMSRSPRGVASAEDSTSRQVASETKTEPGSARASRRAARFTVSPTALNSVRASPPTVPTTTGPVWMPIRARGRRPRSASISAPRASMRCWISMAALQARSGASSRATGAPKSARMPSPVSSCTVPSWRWTTAVISS
ncbi:MAG: hypothetical protein A3K12_10040 [Candidatus Rokubacteria bacterium RIFCSPLOWO2_12_FULL_71_19]|nr:MAG: hypothetical protein A3K12_10040 [Candidatus Rokubacteria bacterium RIFCSPLOWO2_12_FULL_71_19]